MSLYTPTPSPDEIYHHGILGQKWGKRNGPPYPLGASDHSASERKAGWKKSLDGKNQKEYNRSNGDSDDAKPRKGLTDKQKRAIKIGAAAVGAALVVGGTIYLAKTGRLDALINKGKEVIYPSAIAGGDQDLIKKYGKCSISNSNSINKVNPLRNRLDPLASSNCGNCCIAWEMRQRGIDVRASVNSNGMTVSSFGKFFSGMNSDSIKRLDGIDYKAFDRVSYSNRGLAVEHVLSRNILQNYPDGSRGAMFVPFSSGNAHFISWRVSNGKTVFQDAQNNGVINMDDIFKMIRTSGTGPGGRSVNYDKVSLIRLDNLEINSSEIDEVVEKASKIFRNKQKYNTYIEKGEGFIYNWL